ncbi:hypothetical protein AWC38_SpisGene13306 [Stylophora pistillata]|uniref:Uncharacterized protein n=1 Tax=Stylophora pistillata TaxID=50429 RepID=A0A2B4RZG0_STYPI|nr:hypothetical protein AWC38_SpisGene13306 [Stylophora pistillata]
MFRGVFLVRLFHQLIAVLEEPLSSHVGGHPCGTWTVLNSLADPDESVELLSQKLWEMYNDCLPLITLELSSRDPPYMSLLVQHLCKIRNENARTDSDVVRATRQEKINDLVRKNQINAIRNENRKHYRGSKEWWDMANKITELLAEFAAANPQASYAAFTIGLKHRWTYYLRTLPDIEELLEPLEGTIGHVLIPAMTGHTCTSAEWELLALTVRLGDLGLTNPYRDATENAASIRITQPLVKQIEAHALELPDDDDIRKMQ